MKLLLAAVAVLASSAGRPALAWSPDKVAQRDLVSGKPVSEVAAADNGAALITAAIDIPAGAKTVWTVMNDCADMKRIITSLVVCRTLQGDDHGAWAVREQVTKGNLFVPTIHNVVHNDYQPYSLIRFHKAGGDLKVEQGEWRLEPLNGGRSTRVIYVNLVAANIAAPAPLVREGLRRDTAKVLVNLRRECANAVRAGA